MRKYYYYLNGESSSGKTTLAKAIQEKLSDLYLHIGIDKLIGMMPEKINNWSGTPARDGFWWKISQDKEGNQLAEIQTGPYAQKISSLLQEIVLTMAKAGHNLIIDEVCLDLENYNKWHQLLLPYNTAFIAVKAGIETLEHREQQRGNRMVGSSRAQNTIIHFNKTYDLEINTDMQDNEDSIMQIIKLVKDKLKK